MAVTGGRSLEETPTWAVAVVCFWLVAISIAIEHFIHLVGKWLEKKNKKALYEALEKIKSELMLLGFISLLLTVGQGPISRICISKAIGNSWLPCHDRHEDEHVNENFNENSKERLLMYLHSNDADRRVLAAGGYDKCAEQGKVPLLSIDGLHQLHIFIFVLAVFHVVFCINTWALGRLKMRRWKAWETETKTAEYQYSHDPERFRFARDTTFGRRHMSFWAQSTILIWVVSFFRQFFISVPKVDYMTLRHGFVIAHLAPQSQTNFDFQQYINRSLEKDFKVVVGISPPIWLFAVVFLLLNTHGWLVYLWLPFIPLAIILLVGTKLQVIITKMGLSIQDRGEVVKGTPIVQPADNLFWFSRPRILLYLIHFVLFQNAFQLAFLAWASYEFGMRSCFNEKKQDVIIKVTTGLLVQILCSYVTLPLYALVTQMGSNMKPTIFNDKIVKALCTWHQTARKQLKKNRNSTFVTPLSSRSSTPLHASSPAHMSHFYESELDIFRAAQRIQNFNKDDIPISDQKITLEHVEVLGEAREQADHVDPSAVCLYHEVDIPEFSFNKNSAM